MPKVSVIVPVYNAKAFLYKCIDSILALSFNDYELLLIDDGSTDSSGDICDNYSIMDGRVKVFHKENGGVGTARNLGLKYAIGQWVAFVDSDDYVGREYLDVFKKNIPDIDIIHFGYKKESDAGNYQMHYIFDEKEISLEDFFTDEVFSSCCVSYFYKRELLLQNNLIFDANLRYSEDRLFIIQAVLSSRKNIYIINNSSYVYTFNPGSAVNTKRKYIDSIADLVVLNNLYKSSLLCNSKDGIREYITCLLCNSFIYVYSNLTIAPLSTYINASKEFQRVISLTNASDKLYYLIFIKCPLIVILYRKIHYAIALACKYIVKHK